MHLETLPLHSPVYRAFIPETYMTYPHLFQVLFEYSLLSKVLPNDHLIYNHTLPPNPRLLVLLCYSLLQ